MPYIIEKSMPVPTVTRKYPWGDMQVGDSLSFGNNIEFKRAVSAAYNYSHRKGRGGYGMKMKFRQSKIQKRIWRIQ